MKRKLAIAFLGVLVAPSLMAFTQGYSKHYVEQTDKVHVNFTDIGDLSYSYKKYKADIANNTSYYISPIPFKFEDEDFYFQEDNDPFENHCPLIRPYETSDFFITLPKTADVNSYEKVAYSYVNVANDVTFSGNFALHDVYSYNKFTRLAIQCNEKNSNDRSTYAYCVYITYQGKDYNTVTYRDEYRNIYIDVSNNTVVEDITINSIQAFVFEDEPVIERKSSGFAFKYIIKIFLFLALAGLFVLALIITLIIVLVRVSKKPVRK